MKYINTNLLLAHEEVDIEDLEKISDLVLKNNNKIFEPIIVDKNSYVVLDWHHRLEIAKKMFIEKVPVLLVDYFSDNILLETNTWLSKADIIKKAKSLALLEPKSSFHYFFRDWEKFHISKLYSKSFDKKL